MPTVSINKALLLQSLGKDYTDEEFDELCFQFGIEVDEIVEEVDGSTSFKIEVGANRYDLLCLEGISQALNVFLGNSKMPKYKLSSMPECQQQKIVVKSATSQIRAIVVGAVLRNIKFNQQRYDSFIQLQDKLHHNIARKRTLVAIGTHDLKTIKGPFTYDAVPPSQINFVPLNKTEKHRADHLLDLYQSDLHLREYVPIIKDSPVYPLITDSMGVVLSLPPIINGEHSKITLDTTDVFIECTATDKFKAQIVLDTMVCMFSKYCKEPFIIEPVQVLYESSGAVEVWPRLEYKPLTAPVDYCNSLVGIQEDCEGMASKLQLMGLEATPDGENQVKVTVPPTRYDVLHACDVAEDLAVAYGFDKLCESPPLPPTNTIAAELPINYFTDKLRLLMSQNCYTEAATFALSSKADMGTRMGVDLTHEPVVEVGNPKTIDCESLRFTLLPGLLRTLAANKHISLPLKIFECADVCVKDYLAAKTRGTGARNQRHLAAIYYGGKAALELVQGLLDNVMLALKVPHNEQGQGEGYWLEAVEHPSYLSGWCGSVMFNGKEVGRVGVLSPDVITSYNLNNPATALEINVQTILDLDAQPF